MAMRRITAAVRFTAEVPDDDMKADEWADEMSEKILAAVNDIEGVERDSVDVPDWTEEAG